MKVARKEALKNIREAIELYLEPIGDAQIPPPNTGQLNWLYDENSEPAIWSNYKSITERLDCGKTEKKPCLASETYHGWNPMINGSYPAAYQTFHSFPYLKQAKLTPEDFDKLLRESQQVNPAGG